MEVREVLIHYADECRLLSQSERPEVLWIKEIYNRFQASAGCREKKEADNLIYEKMFFSAPLKASDILKIRFWRTGRHVPSNRDICLRFGKALNMTEDEMDYLIKGYYDRSDCVYEKFTDSATYRQRKKVMDEMVSEYLQKIHPGELFRLKIPSYTVENNIRHLYFTDALKYVHMHPQYAYSSYQYHITSINYGSELRRNFELIGEVPRRTMIRHLLILGMPFVNREIIDGKLSALGYLPLTEEHTLTGGERLDWLLIRLLELYEKCCVGKEPEECVIWFQEACRILDQYFAEKKEENLRFMFFKALK